MGGRGSSSAAARARKKAESAAKKQTTKKEPSAIDKTANTVYGRSVKSMTKGLTQAKLQKLSRAQLERIALTITTKRQKEFGDTWTKGGISVTSAFKRAAGTVPNQTTAQLRKLVWKYRNMD